MIRAMLSKWAIIPVSLLLIATYVFSALAMMSSEDLEREMTKLESVVTLTPFIPIIWLLLIIISKIFGVKNRENIYKSICIVILVGTFLSVYVILWLFVL